MSAVAQQSTKEQRIAHLFLTGYSLDLIAERGLTAGWTRGDAEKVADDNGWELDMSGRIPREQRTEAATPGRVDPMPPPTKPVTALARPWQAHPVATGGPLPRWVAALDQARKHPVARIKRQADRLHAQLEQLVTAIDEAEEERKVRERLAQLDAERARLRAQLAKQPATAPRKKTATPGELPPVEHGTWGGYLAEKRRGLDHCADCTAAKDRTMADRAAKQQAGKR